MPEVALVIVNYRSSADTGACIDAVQRTAPDLISEIVVVDNASGDGSVEELRGRHPDVLVLASEENGGFAAGVNVGVARTEADCILVLNPDCKVQEGAVAAMLQRMAGEPRLGVTGPLLLDAAGRPRQDAYKAWPSLWSLFVALCLPVGHALIGTRLHPELLTVEQIEQGHPVVRVCGSALLIRRDAWRDAGPMDDGYFMYFEEVEWQRRVAVAGWGVEMTPQARVVHLVQGGEMRETVPLAYLQSAFRYQGGRGRSPRVIAWTVLTAIAISRFVLAVVGLRPGYREKARRMGGGYRALAALARVEADA